MDLLTNLRTWTPERNAGDTRTDFADLPRGHFSAAEKTGMTRIVEGADDLVNPDPRNQNPGMVKIPTITPDAPLALDGHNPNYRCDNPRCCPVADGPVDARSPRQAELMKGLLEQLMDLDKDTFDQALEYTAKMTMHGRWTAGREGNASRWIGNMIAKVRELRQIAKTERIATPTASADESFQDIPNGYYAISGEGADDIHFFRISRFRDGGIKVQEQASDTLYPVRRGGRRTAVLTAIQTVGWHRSQVMYGQAIGRCGRCNRTLTDAVSRDRGIGPDCWEKM